MNNFSNFLVFYYSSRYFLFVNIYFMLLPKNCKLYPLDFLQLFLEIILYYVY